MRKLAKCWRQLISVLLVLLSSYECITFFGHGLIHHILFSISYPRILSCGPYVPLLEIQTFIFLHSEYILFRQNFSFICLLWPFKYQMSHFINFKSLTLNVLPYSYSLNEVFFQFIQNIYWHAHDCLKIVFFCMQN